MTRAQFIATHPNARRLLAPDHALERRLEQLRAQNKALRVIQRPFDFVFFLIEQRIARIDDEIARLRS